MAKGLGSSFQLPVEYRTRLEGQEAARWHRDRLLERAGEVVAAVRSYLSATASQAQHYLVSTPLKLNTFCASHSTLLTLNNLVFNNNEFNTTSIQHYFNSTTLHFNKFSSTISHSTPLTLNNLTFNNLTFNNLILNTPHIQQSLFLTILVFNTSWIPFFSLFKM